jgi:aspartate racemase
LGGPNDDLRAIENIHMKTLGIVGGIAPESTVDYYRQIIALYRAERSDGGYPRILINSIDLKKMLDLIGAGKLSEVTEYLLAEVVKLAAAGADFALFASNTPHLVFEDVRQRSPIPLVSIVEAACEAALALGLGKVGLLGTRFTMQGGFYPKVFSAHRIEVVVPNSDEQDYVHNRYMGELVHGVYRTETRQQLLTIVKRLRSQEGIQGLILGGTELPLLFRDGPQSDIPVLDTTKIHVERAVTCLLAQEPPNPADERDARMGAARSSP